MMDSSTGRSSALSLFDMMHAQIEHMPLPCQCSFTSTATADTALCPTVLPEPHNVFLLFESVKKQFLMQYSGIAHGPTPSFDSLPLLPLLLPDPSFPILLALLPSSTTPFKLDGDNFFANSLHTSPLSLAALDNMFIN